MMKYMLFVLCCIFSLSLKAQLMRATVYEFSDKCPKDKPFVGTYGDYSVNETPLVCRGCDDPEGLLVKKGHEKDFEICSERETIKRISRLKKCPDNFFFNQYGECVSCNTLEFVTVLQSSDCNACPNREVVDTKDYGLHCQLKTCPHEAPLNVGGDCKSCEAEVFPQNPKEACEKCPNRLFIPKDYTVYQDNEKRIYIEEDMCIPREREEEWDEKERPILQLGKYISKEMFNPTMGRTVVLGSIISTCDDCDASTEYRLQYENWYGSCSEKLYIETLPEFCAKCPNRVFKEGKCVRQENTDKGDILD